MKKTTTKWFAGVAGAGVVLGILVAVNLLFAGVRLRKDLTAERLYTLSPGTVAMLKGLERPVTLKFYCTKGHPDLPAPLKGFVQRTLDFLREVAARSGGRVVLETWDPQPDSEAEEWAQRYGLLAQPTGGLGAQPDLYLGLVAVAGIKEASIPFLDPGMEPQLEYLLMRLLQEATRDRRPRLGIASSLPVFAEPVSPFRPVTDRNQDWLFVSELKKQYEVVPVALDAEEIPAGIDALLLVHPRGMTDRALFAVDQYLLQGGRLVAYVDPMCISAEELLEDGGMPVLSSDINRLSGAWGITVQTARVVADLAAATPIQLGDGRAERLPGWLSLRAGTNLAREEIVTESLESLMMPFAGQILGSAGEGLAMTTLVSASGEAVVLNSYQARNPEDAGTRNGTPAPGAALAVRLAGRFPTAFPDGPPPREGETNETAAATNGWLKAGEADGAVILVADADLLANGYSARAVRLLGQTLYQPFNDNLNFTLNIAEQLSGNPELIGLRSRGRYEYPFERVLALEQAAQAQWQEEEAKLQQKLVEAQRRLNELQSAKSEDQQLVLSAEQKAEVERFRQERFETQRQLKEVRKNLRHSIEKLGLTLKVLNMAAVPVVVAVFGIGFGWRRRRRAAA